jgi:hypothetical protein
VKRILLRVLAVALLVGAAAWLLVGLNRVLGVYNDRGQVPTASMEFVKPFLTALAEALFPAGAMVGGAAWALRAASQVRRRRE